MHKCIRKVVVLSLIVVFFAYFLSPCFAYDRTEHNPDLEKVLFIVKPSTKDKKTIINDIENAVYLTIDQFHQKDKNIGLKEYRLLKRHGVKGLPHRFSSIDYEKDPIKGTVAISGTNHRKYTHEGWNRKYENKKAQDFWELRKKILLATLNSIFAFKKGAVISGYTTECNSLAGILYCTHILGDIIEKSGKRQKLAPLQALAGHRDGTDMISDLKSFVEVLFVDQKKTVKYKQLWEGMEKIESRASKIVNTTGGVNSEEDFNEYGRCAQDLLNLLKDTVPYLLNKEDFFKQVF